MEKLLETLRLKAYVYMYISKLQSQFAPETKERDTETLYKCK